MSRNTFPQPTRKRHLTVLLSRSGVVAPDFKVHRTANLRVVDASVIPFTFSVAPLATVFAIAEKVIDSPKYLSLPHADELVQAADVIKAAGSPVS